MKKMKISTVLAFTTAILLTACSTDDVASDSQTVADSTTKVSLDDINYNNVPTLQLPDDVKLAIKKMGMKDSDFGYIEINLNSRKKKGFVTYNDISVSKDEFIARANSEDSKQYSTQFIVDVDVFETIDLFVYTGPAVDGTEGLTPASVAALELAVENWNSAQSNIVFTTTISDNTEDFDNDPSLDTIIAAANIDSSGLADIPSPDGFPGFFAVISIPINNAAQFISQEVMEHLFTHELGHTIGLRHSDWDTRYSCVLNGVEDQESTETPAANLIFGTPPSNFYQPDSVMNACFGSDTTGNPNFQDKVALRLLYGFNFPY